MELEEFEKVVEHAIATLPDFIRSKLQNIDIVIEEQPIVHKSLLGLYQGVPLKKRGVWYGNVMPDKITLFKKNIERISSNEDIISGLTRKDYRIVDTDRAKGIA
jgi:predicted Zn-dependent protease with MMP-like domain